MRVAVVGAGGNFGRKRTRAIHRSGDDVVAVCDLDPAAAAAAAPTPATAVVSDHRELALHDVDAVAVCLPDHRKLAIVEEILDSGRHVLVEKPLSLHRSDVTRLFDLASERGVALYVGYNLRFFPSVAALLDLLERGTYGRLRHIRLFYGHGGAHSLAGAGNWRTGPESWGGAFVDMGTHLLSLVGRLVSDVESGALERQATVTRETEDTAALLLRVDGCVIEIASTWKAWRSRFSVEAYADEGFTEVEGLLKYVKYGQEGERLRHGRRRDGGAPEIHELWWREGDVDQETVELEFLDEEWRWFADAIAAGTFDLERERRVNGFVADVSEAFYR